NLYVAWALDTGAPSGRQVYISASSATSGWRTWTKPVQVSDGSTGIGDAVNVFPWIKAGGPGRADAVWYGSNMNVDPSSQSGQAWNVFMNQVVFPVDKSGAITGQAPSTTLVKVSPHPMHYNDICLQGTGCISSQGNRNLADFFTVTIDKSGAAEIVYDDTSNGLAQPGFTPTGNQTIDHAGAPLVSVARQSSGPGLYGTAISGPPHAPAAGASDPAADPLYPGSGRLHVPGLHILGSAAPAPAPRHPQRPTHARLRSRSTLPTSEDRPRAACSRRAEATRSLPPTHKERPPMRKRSPTTSPSKSTAPAATTPNPATRPNPDASRSEPIACGPGLSPEAHHRASGLSAGWSARRSGSTAVTGAIVECREALALPSR